LFSCFAASRKRSKRKRTSRTGHANIKVEKESGVGWIGRRRRRRRSDERKKTRKPHQLSEKHRYDASPCQAREKKK